ncbi:MAG: type III-A CRISPR-associated RAMP protein Csm4 [Syntrophorhabdaceae bacterium]|nr:type III-A CRISPR-associated RAMP protein Csm4 [Syntrophorhabdaceae bacterium]
MQNYLFKLKFKGPTHFGDTGIDLENVSERVTSDTLFSALVNTIKIIEGKDAAADFVNQFLVDPPFLLSSLFVYYKNNFFLPRPLTDLYIQDEYKANMGKELKKLSWITAENFYKWINNDVNGDDLKNMVDEQEKYKEAFIKEVRPRVSLDRISQGSNIYHCGYVYFKEDAGLYGLVMFKKIDTLGYFQKILENLGEIGLGGEKTYGAGMFKVSSLEQVDNVFKKVLTCSSPYSILLSLYHPSENEVFSLQDKLIAYNILRKKGWITTGRNTLTLKRKSVGFITEGSVILGNLKGCLVDVTPDSIPSKTLNHNIYRYGYAFVVPLGGVNGQ